MKARIIITLKKGVLDPQGKAVKGALENLGFNIIEDVRVGKVVDISLNTNEEKRAKEAIEEMCKKLLANPVIEDYMYHLEE